MQPLDLDYYRARAAAERRIAQTCDNADVAAIHEALAAKYEALLEEARTRQTLHIVASRDPGPHATPV